MDLSLELDQKPQTDLPPPTGADRKPTQEPEARDCSAASDWPRAPWCFGPLGESEFPAATIGAFLLHGLDLHLSQRFQKA